MSAVLAQAPHTALTAERPPAPPTLVACGSLEMSPDRVSEVRTVATSLPLGAKVYVNHLPRHALAGSLPTLSALREAGLGAGAAREPLAACCLDPSCARSWSVP